jgi:hypothetical protein
MLRWRIKFNKVNNMLAVIYRAWVKPDCEKLYRHHWQVIADYFVKHCGALGSALHKSESGYYVVYSRWPDKQTWENSWPSYTEKTAIHIPAGIASAICEIKSYIDEDREKFPEIITTVVADKL